MQQVCRKLSRTAIFIISINANIYQCTRIFDTFRFSFFRHLLLCRVTLGKSFLQFSAMKMAHAPPGHHSVMGKPSQGGLVFPEYVVYRGEQAYPEYLITYQIARPQQESGDSESVEER